MHLAMMDLDLVAPAMSLGGGATRKRWYAGFAATTC